MITLEYHFISQPEVDRFEQTSYNPPKYDDTFTSAHFDDEWHKTKAALKERLELFGKARVPHHENEMDFELSESRGDSRWLYVTLRSDKMWRRELVPAIADLLSNLPQDYRVCLFNHPPMDALFDSPFIYVVISPTTVWGKAQRAYLDDNGQRKWKEWNASLERLGFPVK